MYKTRNDLSANIREQSIALLQKRLSDAIDLFTQIKQAHWNVKGPNFIALHELFDAIAQIVEDQSDLLAERITALGGRADGTARVAAKQSALPEFPLDITTGVAYVTAVADRLGAYGASARAAIDSTAQFGDADTADIFTEISREIDKQLWFIEAHLQSDK
jgi:starvation-inducible DNA-binding protein